MINWSIGFINNYKQLFLDSSFVFAFCGLIVSTFFDIAFHGLLRIRLAGGKNQSTPPAKPNEQYFENSSLDTKELDSIFNVF